MKEKGEKKKNSSCKIIVACAFFFICIFCKHKKKHQTHKEGKRQRKTKTGEREGRRRTLRARAVPLLFSLFGVFVLLLLFFVSSSSSFSLFSQNSVLFSFSLSLSASHEKTLHLPTFFSFYRSPRLCRSCEMTALRPNRKRWGKNSILPL